MPRTLGVCSWSLQPSNPAQLAERARACGLSAVQLALDPLREGGAWSVEQTRETLAGAGVSIASGMMTTLGEDYTSLESIKRTGGLRPDERWPHNRERARANAEIAGRLGIGLVTLHAGFLPHERSDPEHAVMVERLAEVSEIFAGSGVTVALETGQEAAETLDELLEDPGLGLVGVNFDPANMILYGMGDPLAALELLAPRVRQVHLKDATPTAVPGEWGAEVSAGSGAVDWSGFFEVVRSLPESVGVMIEREAGESRVEDINAARELASAHGLTA